MKNNFFKTKKLVRRVALFNTFANLNYMTIGDIWILISASAVCRDHTSGKLHRTLVKGQEWKG